MRAMRRWKLGEMGIMQRAEAAGGMELLESN